MSILSHLVLISHSTLLENPNNIFDNTYLCLLKYLFLDLIILIVFRHCFWPYIDQMKSIFFWYEDPSGFNQLSCKAIHQLVYQNCQNFGLVNNFVISVPILIIFTILFSRWGIIMWFQQLLMISLYSALESFKCNPNK